MKDRRRIKDTTLINRLYFYNIFKSFLDFFVEKYLISIYIRVRRRSKIILALFLILNNL